MYIFLMAWMANKVLGGFNLDSLYISIYTPRPPLESRGFPRVQLVYNNNTLRLRGGRDVSASLCILLFFNEIADPSWCGYLLPNPALGAPVPGAIVRGRVYSVELAILRPRSSSVSTSRAKTDATCIMHDMRDDRDTSWIFNIASVDTRPMTIHSH